MAEEEKKESIAENDDKAGEKADDDSDENDEKGDDDEGKTQEDQASGPMDVEEILDEYGLDSADELKDFIAGLSDMKGKIGDHDLDTLIANTKTLEKYQANWQQQEEANRRDKETPEETIKRLEKEKQDLQTQNITQAERQKAARQAEKALVDFGDTVESVISSTKELPKEYRDFASLFVGVDNPIHEVDITDKAKVRRTTKGLVKEIMNFEQAVIKRYRSGKVKIPKVGKTEPTPGSTGETEKANPKNLKEAKKLMMQSLAGFASKK